jgi:hypothetical protein
MAGSFCITLFHPHRESSHVTTRSVLCVYIRTHDWTVFINMNSVTPMTLTGLGSIVTSGTATLSGTLPPTSNRPCFKKPVDDLILLSTYDRSSPANTLKLTASVLQLQRGGSTLKINVDDLFDTWPVIQRLLPTLNSLLPTLREMAAPVRDKAARRIQRWWKEERHAPPSMRNVRGGPEFRKWWRQVRSLAAPSQQ